MKKLSVVAATCLFLLNTAWAETPQRLHVEESVQLNAPADRVWAVIGDFSGLAKWHPAIKSSFMNTPVSRVLDLGDGKRLLEELESKDDASMTLRYRIASMTNTGTANVNGKKVEVKVLPVNTYSSTLNVSAEGATSKVTWSGDFYRAWLGDAPIPSGMGDEDASNAIKGVYQAGLNNLATVLGVNGPAAPEAPKAPEAPATTTEAPKAPEAPAATTEAPKAPEAPAATTEAPKAPEAPAATATAQASAGGTAYDGHVQCEGGACKIDSFLTKGFRAFSQCQVCHGIDGAGSTIAPSLMTKLKELDHATFIDRVANGYQGQVGVMPPWKDNPNIMNNIENLYAYLKARSDGVIPAGKLEKF